MGQGRDEPRNAAPVKTVQPELPPVASVSGTK